VGTIAIGDVVAAECRRAEGHGQLAQQGARPGIHVQRRGSRARIGVDFTTDDGQAQTTGRRERVGDRPRGRFDLHDVRPLSRQQPIWIADSREASADAGQVELLGDRVCDRIELEDVLQSVIQDVDLAVQRRQGVVRSRSRRDHVRVQHLASIRIKLVKRVVAPAVEEPKAGPVERQTIGAAADTRRSREPVEFRPGLRIDFDNVTGVQQSDREKPLAAERPRERLLIAFGDFFAHRVLSGKESGQGVLSFGVRDCEGLADSEDEIVEPNGRSRRRAGDGIRDIGGRPRDCQRRLAPHCQTGRVDGLQQRAGRIVDLDSPDITRRISDHVNADDPLKLGEVHPQSRGGGKIRRG